MGRTRSHVTEMWARLQGVLLVVLLCSANAISAQETVDATVQLRNSLEQLHNTLRLWSSDLPENKHHIDTTQLISLAAPISDTMLSDITGIIVYIVLAIAVISFNHFVLKKPSKPSPSSDETVTTDVTATTTTSGTGDDATHVGAETKPTTESGAATDKGTTSTTPVKSDNPSKAVEQPSDVKKSDEKAGKKEDSTVAAAPAPVKKSNCGSPDPRYHLPSSRTAFIPSGPVIMAGTVIPRLSNQPIAEAAKVRKQWSDGSLTPLHMIYSDFSLAPKHLPPLPIDNKDEVEMDLIKKVTTPIETPVHLAPHKSQVLPNVLCDEAKKKAAGDPKFANRKPFVIPQVTPKEGSNPDWVSNPQLEPSWATEATHMN